MTIPTPPGPHARVIFVGVGQGDCTLLVFPDPPHGTGDVVLIDCGSTKGARCLITTPDQEVVDALTNVQRLLTTYVPKKTIDYLFITHADEDHYNLLVRALNGFTVKRSYYTGVLEDYQNGRDSFGSDRKNATYNWLKAKGAIPLANSLAFSGPPPGGSATDPWQFGHPVVPLGGEYNDGLYVLAANASGSYATRHAKWQKFLDPATDPHEKVRLRKELERYDPNPDSAVMALTYKRALMMLMGDATELTENFILGASPPNFPSANITLKMGHHGSNTSSCERWVKRLRPHRLVVSSGTKPFNGSGIPKLSHLENVKQWSGTVTQADSHEYTYFDDRTPSIPSFLVDQTDRAVFTTQLMVNPDWTSAMPDEGRFICGTWHLTIDGSGKVEIGYGRP
ncbi:ComEC/Rec2 family competence protein [Streptomyces platensis]|uniref:ComEC/Rec2 family competence protein n=1 Tax=Streptomyces platensis TaxID=58346 RepID=UPI0036C2E84E